MNASRTAELNIRLTEFEVPPVQDFLVIGKRAPIGIEAFGKMVEFISPNQYKAIRLNHEKFEGIIIRKNFLNVMEEELLISAILVEVDAISDESSIFKGSLNIMLNIKKEIEI
ncbi:MULTISPECIES: hypothetical protein [Carboxydothermus]|uniref:Uncharacterized protein n=3 Tax=Carboxydothermus TaxID=129957 RepID=Q3AFS6_CARHZ|nr:MULTISPECIES: hypothetical protein [Carboxydothermus]ABB15986.1 hypothetical protein CHY_0136 [Carboxydothermus hydrogenoformans Z-2901]NYE57446.1 hypothetical protein [Carboxydothermus ferrireducens DSM 11255]GAV25273.1 hypothetical protein ciss_12060 [Carboxydothermus islandicus]